MSIPASAFSYQTIFTPRLTVSEEYTDNLFLTRDDKDHDFITAISPGATFEIIQKSNRVAIAYDPAYSIYARHSENDTWRHEVSLTGSMGLTRYRRFIWGTRSCERKIPSQKGIVR